MTAAPRRVHFLWSGRNLPYHCRLAVESVLVHVPDCEVRLHVFGDPPGGRHLREVARHRRVTIDTIDLEQLFARCPGGARPYIELVARTRSAAAASDLIRLAVLLGEGGVCLDTDVLVLRELHDPDDHGTFVGSQVVRATSGPRSPGLRRGYHPVRTSRFVAGVVSQRLDARVTGGRLRLAGRPIPACLAREQVSNAVVGAQPDSPFIARSLTAALEVDPTVRDALGSLLLDDLARRSPRDVRILPPSRFHAVPPSQSFRLFEQRGLELPLDAMAIHLVASRHRRLLTRLAERDPRFDQHDAVFWRAARQVRSRVPSVARPATVSGVVSPTASALTLH